MDVWEIVIVNYNWDEPIQIIRVATETTEIDEAIDVAKSKISENTKIYYIRYLYGVYIKDEK